MNSSPTIGGWVQTEKIVRNDTEYIIDWGPQSFRSTGGDQPTSALIRSLKLQIAMLDNKRSIFTDGLIREVPMSLWKMANNAWMRGLLRGVFWDLLCPFTYLFVDHDQDESVHAFVTRHFGSGIREDVIRAVAHGIYGAEIEDLSVGVMMPIAYELARSYKSVLLGALITATGKFLFGQPPPKQTMQKGPYKLAAGMAELTEALANASTAADIHLSCPVTAVTRRPNGTFDVVAGGRHFFCRKIVFTSNPNTIRYQLCWKRHIATAGGGCLWKLCQCHDCSACIIPRH